MKLKQAGKISESFTDLIELSDWASGDVYALVNKGYIQGSNGKLNPKGYITRGEFAQVMNNSIKTYINKPGEHYLQEQGNVMINTPDVTLKDSIIPGDIIIGDGVGDGDVVLDHVEVKGRLQ